MALLEVENLKVLYGRVEALHGISLSVEQGEVVTLIGSNGAGKTTTVRTISGLVPASGGKIRLDGDDITGSVRSADSQARNRSCPRGAPRLPPTNGSRQPLDGGLPPTG